MKKFFTILLLFTAVYSFAQITFQPGYFINNQGVKTECLIKNVAWKNNPVEFDYKLTETADVQKGYIKAVAEFSVSGYHFIRFTTNLDRSTNDLFAMSILKEPEWVKETLFLNALVEGKATLYQYEDGNLVRFFVSTENSPEAQQLVYKPYKASDTEVGYNNQFRGQLYTIMKGEISDSEKFKHLKYDKDVLVKLFTQYGGINGNVVTNATLNQNKTTLNFKITAGAAFSSLSASQTLTYRTSEINFASKTSFRVGAEVEVVLPFNNNKWSLFINPGYQSYKAQEKRDNWRVDYTFIDVPVGVRHYMYVGKKSRIFINAAYVLGINLNDSRVSTDYQSNSSKIPLYAKVSSSSNIAAGAGFSYNNFSIEARYGFNRPLLGNYHSWMADYTSLNIILGYKIL